MDPGATSDHTPLDKAAAQHAAGAPPARHFDVFLSHNGLDKPAVLRVARKLRQAGVEPWLDKWYLEGGGFWQEGLGAALQASSACAVFIGPHGLGDWGREELGYAQVRAAVDRSFRLVPVLLPGVQDPFVPSAVLPPFLSTRTWVDFRGRGLNDPTALQMLINAIKGVPSGPDQTTEHQDGRPPYRALQPFDEEDADLFFGRDADVQRLLEKMKTSRFLAVLGPSGSGKSSLVRAGLVPALRQGELSGSADWTIHVLKPGALPLESLALAITGLRRTSNPIGTTRQIEDDLRSNADALHKGIRLVVGNDPGLTLLVIDQAEEVFTLCRDEVQRAQFLTNLVYAASVPDGPCAVVLTLRADFYHRCAAYPGLARQLAAQQFLVSPMAPEALRQVIEEPALRVGLEFEEGLVDAILEDVARQPGALPLLEDALWELWERRRGRMLTLEGYRASGGVAGALSERADDLYKGLDEPDQVIAQYVLTRLTEPGEGTEDTRHPTAVRELITPGAERAAVDGVVQKLIHARLLTISDDEQTGEQIVDVTHEALIRGWPRLRGWIDADRPGLRIHHRLGEAAQDWQRSEHDPGLLYRGARLAEASEWAHEHAGELNTDEQAFLAASVALLDRERRIARQRALVTICGLLVFLVVASALAVYGFAQTRLATAGELAASASAQLAADPDVSLLLAIRALGVQPTTEAEDALREAYAASHLQRELRGHSGPLTSIAFSAGDGRLLLTASKDGTARVWDVATGAAGPVLGELGGYSIKSAEFSPDASRILTAGDDGTARVWDTRAGALLHSVSYGEQTPVLVARFDSAGRHVVVAPRSSVAEIWDPDSDTRIPLSGHAEKDIVTDARFSPDPNSKWVVTGSRDGAAIIWDARDGSIVKRLSPHRDEVTSASFSPNSAYLVTASRDKTARVWDTRTWQVAANLPDHVGQINAAIFSADNERLATRSDDWTIRVWDVSEARLQKLRDTGADAASLLQFQLRSHAREIKDVAFSGDHVLLATAGDDKTTRISDGTGADRGLNADRTLSELRGHTEAVVAVAFSPDAKRVATASADGTARIWDPGGGRSLADFDIERRLAEGISYLANGTRVATRSRTAPNGTAPVQLLEAVSLRKVADLEPQASEMVPSPTGDRLLTFSGMNGVNVYDATTGALLRNLGGPQTRAVFSADGQRIVTGGADGTVDVWESPGLVPRRLTPMAGVTRIQTLDVDRSSQRIVTTSSVGNGQQLQRDRTAQVWKSAGGAPVPLDHLGPVQSAAFSPDGSRVLTVAGDSDAPRAPRSVTLWDISGNKPTTRWSKKTEQKPVDSAVFSSNGARVVVKSTDSVLHLWDAESGAVINDDMGGTADCLLGAVLGRPNGCQFSPDGGLLVAGRKELTPRVWDLETGTARTLFGDTQGQKRVAFSRDGAFFATGSEDGSVRVWPARPSRPAATEPLLVVRSHQNAVRALALSPDSSRILTQSQSGDDTDDMVDGMVRLFACEVCAPTGELVHEACARLARDLSEAERRTFLTQRQFPLLDRWLGLDTTASCATHG